MQVCGNSRAIHASTACAGTGWPAGARSPRPVASPSCARRSSCPPSSNCQPHVMFRAASEQGRPLNNATHPPRTSPQVRLRLSDEPLLRVRPGESFEIETYDASTGFFKPATDKAIPGVRPGSDRTPPLANPIGGPIFLEAPSGATRLSSPSRTSWSTIIPGSRSVRAAGLGRLDPLAGTLRRIYDEDLQALARAERHDARWDAALQRQDLLADYAVHRYARRLPGPRSHHQPRRPRRMGREPRHSRRRPGQPVHLPVFHAGALFCMGDVHASQGDTEFTGTAAETKATAP